MVFQVLILCTLFSYKILLLSPNNYLVPLAHLTSHFIVAALIRERATVIYIHALETNTFIFVFVRPLYGKE